MMLPQDLLWDGSGHVHEVALTALADGQDALVPADVHAHVVACEACTAKLAEATLLSLETAEALSLARLSKVPWPAVAAGLALAALGTLPTVLDARQAVAELVIMLRVTLPALWKTAQTPAMAAVLAPASLLLVAFGFFIARSQTRARITEGAST
jgi:hypothetical protein